MFASLFSPFGTSGRGALLRLCSKLYLAQVCYVILGADLISFLAFENMSLAKLLGSLFIFGIVFVFPYLHICAYSKRLQSLSYNRLWLIAISAILYFTVLLTTSLAGQIIPENLFHTVSGAYVRATSKLLFQLVVMLSGYMIVSIGVAYLPETKRPAAFNAA